MKKSRDNIIEIVNSTVLEYDLKVVWEQQRLPLRIHPMQIDSSPSNLPELLQLRSMEYFLYARVIGSIMFHNRMTADQDTRMKFHPREDTQPIVDRCCQLMLQINDLADAIVYAQQDIQSNSAKLLDTLRFCADDHQIEPMLRRLMFQNQQQLAQLPLSEPTATTVQKYASALIAMLDGQEVSFD